MSDNHTQENNENPDDQIRNLVEDNGIEYVLEILSVICREKAGEMRAYYGDETAARGWEDFGRELYDKEKPT